MSSIPQSPDIYQITCIPTGKIYIGSAVNLATRWRDHRKTLRGQCHSNSYLQHAWDKYGEAAFSFTVLEIIEDKQELLGREQAWLDHTRCYDDSIGFNICPTAGSNLGRTFSKEYGQRIRERNSDTWKGFIDPEGNERIIVGLWGFCKSIGLHFGAMWNLARGKGRTKSYKGWTHKDNPPTRVIKTYDGFIDPDGNAIGSITGITPFCEARGLDQNKMREVAKGNRHHHQGWTYKDNPPTRALKTYHGFIDPDGNAVGPVTGIDAFCVERGLSSSKMIEVAKSKRRSHKGWTYRHDVFE